MTVRINQMQSNSGGVAPAQRRRVPADDRPLIVFFALQRYFVQGLLAGSVK